MVETARRAAFAKPPQEASPLSASPGLAALRQRQGALFIAFPGDEEQYGGCALWEKREWVAALAHAPVAALAQGPVAEVV